MHHEYFAFIAVCGRKLYKKCPCLSPYSVIELAIFLTFLQALNVSIEFYVHVCYEGSSPSFFWQIFIFVFLAVLQIMGILLAFQTRKVKLQGLRDSKFITAIIYISSIVLVALALVTFSLRTYINIGTGIFAGGIFILTTIFLSLIFLPKVNTNLIICLHNATIQYVNVSLWYPNCQYRFIN